MNRPLIGGVFAVPAVTFPDTLGKITLFREFPYLLPCMISASIAFISFLFVLVGLKEVKWRCGYIDTCSNVI
jgi:hypothetical protein